MAVLIGLGLLLARAWDWPGAAPLLGALPVAGNLAVAWRFGGTLRPGRLPLIARFIALDFGGRRPELDGYARAQTWLWTVLAAGFGLMHMAYLFLEARGSPQLMAWNLGIMLLIFVGEHWLRRFRYPQLGPASPLRTCRVIAAAMGPGRGR